MAHLKKFTDAAVNNILRHNSRTIKNDSNRDIDPTRTSLNYSLGPKRDIGPFEYYKKRKKELYVYKRENVKTMAGWVITLPAEIIDGNDEIIFFEMVYKFLEKRYGINNVVQAIVHKDEGKMENIINNWTKEVEKDENGKNKTRLVMGKPHMHFCFIPVTVDTNQKHQQNEKICANDVLDKNELQHFHGDLEKFLHEAGIYVNVKNGKTQRQGRNMSVSEYKEYYEDIQNELVRLRNIEKKYQYELTRKVERVWR